MLGAGYALPLPVSLYGHATDGVFDKANAGRSLITPFEKFQPGTIYYEWKDIAPRFHAIQGLGDVSYWYEAKDTDVNPQWHYVMNDFVGRTKDLKGTLDNWFYWKGQDQTTWGVKIFGTNDPFDPDFETLKVWKGVTLDTTGVWPVLGLSNAQRNYTSGIVGAYQFDISPRMEYRNFLFGHR